MLRLFMTIFIPLLIHFHHTDVNEFHSTKGKMKE